MEWLPTPSWLVLMLAVPPESCAVPSELLPSTKVTVPVGVPTPGALADTVAVSVKDWPNTVAGFEEVTAAVVPSGLTVTASEVETGLAAKLVSPL